MPAQAAWEYQEAAALAPGSVAAHVGLAQALTALHLHEVAATRLRDFLQRTPGAGDARRQLAAILLGMGRPEEAVAALKADPDRAPPSPEVLMLLGRAHLAMGQLQPAGVAFDRLAGLEPGSPEGAYWRGEVARRQGRVAEARSIWQQAATQAPSDARFPHAIGLTFAADPAKGSVDRAGAAFNMALQRDSRHVPARLQIGRLYLRHGHPREAAREFMQAVEAAPSDPEPRRLLADALVPLGEAAEAHRQRGLAFSLADQPLRAVPEFQRLAEARPGDVDAALLLCQSWIQMQQNGRAAAVIDRALRRHPKNAELRERLAGLYILTQSRAEAEQICRDWLRDDPNAARAYWLLGRAALADRRPDDALRHFEAAVARAPADLECAASLGAALDSRPSPEERERALTLLRAAAAGNSAAHRHRLAVAFQQRGDWERAREQLLESLSLDPAQPVVYNALPQIAQGLGRPHQVQLWAQVARAVQERHNEQQRLRRASAARPRDPEPHLALARLLLTAGDLRRARGRLEQALHLRPRWPAAEQLLARVAAVEGVMADA
jgi:tetratricopeptide (TPR) repeat protein